jgi:ABC-type nickel/cobalt efflux system permease component RcnA
VLDTSNRPSLIFASGVLVVGTAAYMIRSKLRGEWPFGEQKAVGSRQ